MHISVIGTGYVGLVTGACFAEFGMYVTCVDNVEEKIAELQEGRVSIHEPGLPELVAKNLREGRLSFTTDAAKAIEQSLVVFIAVGTPARADGAADLRYIDEVADTIGQCMQDYKVIATKSTVPVGTAMRIKERIRAVQRQPVAFSVVSNPEFLREGSAIEDFMRPNRVVIGAEDPHAIAIMKELYSPLYLIETPFVITDILTAEMIKYAANAFLAMKISFINEIATLCDAVGADVHDVAKGIGLDQRIGRKFLHPGPGYGGSCFPKDVQGLIHFAREAGVELELAPAVDRVNRQQRQRMVHKILGALEGTVAGKTIGVLGLSFKPNTDDIRESPALDIVAALLAQGAHVKAYDPAAMPAARRVLPDVEYCPDAYAVCKGSDAVVLLTEWNQFRALDLQRIRALLAQPVMVDLRNVYEPETMQRLGFRYVAVGRRGAFRPPLPGMPQPAT
ncbi:MAG: UDP-glucose 6-dehydrogenase [Candidatus Tectimicrobiota bacterium]|nr:MAG: UDP-glucose 6-dehydrogenase [Candidatus Tectomicrobia bacterium]